MVHPLPKHRARDYETIFIVHPDTQVDAIEQIAGRVTDAIDRREGKLLKAENWGKRRLAYPVRKQLQGYYIYLRYLGYSDLVHEIERNLRMIEPVLKYLTVKIDEDVDPAARPVSENDISFVPQIEEEPEPEIPSAMNDDAEEDAQSEELKEDEDDIVEDTDADNSNEETDSPETSEEEEAE